MKAAIQNVQPIIAFQKFEKVNLKNGKQIYCHGLHLHLFSNIFLKIQFKKEKFVTIQLVL